MSKMPSTGLRVNVCHCFTYVCISGLTEKLGHLVAGSEGEYR